MSRVRRLTLWTIGMAAALLAAPCHAQNIDAGKSPAQIFADTCAACHRSARELKRPRAVFLRQHYMAGSVEATAMANYLSGVSSDPRAAQPKRPPAGAGAGLTDVAKQQPKQQPSAEQAKSTQAQARGRRPAATAESAGPSQAAAAEERQPAVPLAQSPMPPPAHEGYNLFWGALAGVFLLLAIAAIGSAVYVWQQLKTNEGFLHATLKRVTEMVEETVAQAEKYNVPRTATFTFLGKAEGLFDDMAQYSRPTPQLRYRKAWMLIQFARNYAILGDTGRQFARANEAYRLLAGLAVEKPDDITYQRDLSVAYAGQQSQELCSYDIKRLNPKRDAPLDRVLRRRNEATIGRDYPTVAPAHN